jgi:iron complex outermembrane receptor protein
VGAGVVNLNVQLKTDYLNLNEVVVVGYGTKQAKDLTGSVTSVSSDDFQKGNIASPEQLLTGKVAGLQVTSDGGSPGSGSTIRIRGGTSINASNDPLIVIDGVPIENSKTADGKPSINGSGNALNLINPNEIEKYYHSERRLCCGYLW